MTKKKEVVKEEPVIEKKTNLTFTKSQIIEAKRFASNTDILNVLLDDDKVYKLEDVDLLIKSFNERKVK